ncbi:MAG: ABC transporter ATP-binding protein [Acidimicrobiia bacterium]|nr:ABC transporter ATP-binding protein [Acidimicrobiia bacterium]MDH4308274.1 ABC transporter ATP-binding protein [Acidimicrobiia bacterium]
MTEQANPTIRAREVSKRFGNTVALDGFSLDVWKGGLLTLLGPSGCGKTTALRIIAGFDRPDSGSVDLNGTPVVSPGLYTPPERRSVGMVFQDYALFPHMTVEQNIAYGLGKDRRHRIAEALELVGLSAVAKRHPHELSGGQQQRVALARAIAPEPEVILFDEPFSNLDATLRDRVRRELRSILTNADATAVFVTHDQEEALAMSDVVAVMREGRVLQAAPPDLLYRRPADPWTAAFIGDADFLDGHASGGQVATAVGVFPTDLTGRVSVMIRPEAVRIDPDPAGAARVLDREYYGHDQLVTVALENGSIVRSRMGPWPVLDVATPVTISIGETSIFPVPGDPS